MTRIRFEFTLTAYLFIYELFYDLYCIASAIANWASSIAKRNRFSVRKQVGWE